MSTTSGGADRRRRILRVVPPACPPRGDEVVAALIQRILGDLDAGRVDVSGALRVIASAAWREGHDAGRERPAPVETGPRPKPFRHRPRLPDGGADDYIVLIIDPATGTVGAQGPFPGATAKTVADQARVDLNAAGLREFTVTITRLLPFRLRTT